MKDENIKKLNDELKYLVDSERKLEIEKYQDKLSIKDINVKEIAKEIYLKRGIDYSKLKTGFLNNLANTISDLSTVFKNKDKATKQKMIIDLVLNFLVLILLKIPFDFVRDIGADYISAISSNQTIYNIWNLAFLLFYTIILVCTFIVLMNSFNRKYKNV